MVTVITGKIGLSPRFMCGNRHHPANIDHMLSQVSPLSLSFPESDLSKTESWQLGVTNSAWDS